MASLATIKAVFRVLGARWPKHPIGGATIEVYHQCLQDVPDELLQHAVVQYMRTAKWFPGVSELLDEVDALFTDEQNSLDAEGAWGQVMRWRCHPTRVTLPDLVKAAMDVLAIPEYSTEDSIMSDRARYCARFKALRERKRSERRMLPEVKRLAEEMRMDQKIEAKRDRAKQLEASNA